jgi:GntR family transcriptional regulator/MocR family aminotransferase
MTRPLQHWDLALDLDPGASHQALFVRIARAVSDDIRGGRLRPGARLPGTRVLAASLRVHRNTVIAAFRELCAEGYLEARTGQGTFVSATLPEPKPRALSRGRARDRARQTRQKSARPPACAPRASDTPRATYEPIPKRALAMFGGLPDLRLLPRAALARAYRRALRDVDVLGYGDPRGLPRLREALSIMLRASRGLRVGADQIVVTRGSQMALALGARALLAPGDLVAVEQYGYRPAWAALRASGARLHALPVDREGLDVDALAALCRRRRVRAVYLTPHHQYPTTVTLSASRRLRLLDLASQHGLAILEDDYDHEFHYDGRPILPIASADADGSVLYVGTLSKVVAPTLRVGYAVAPPAMLARMTDERFYLDRQGDQVTEAALAELIEDGELQRHVRRTRRLYQRRRDALVEHLRAAFGERLRVAVPSGGMALWAKVDARVSVEAWLARARARNVLFQPGRWFHFGDRAVPYARFGFGALTEDELCEAVSRLRATF